MKKRSFYFKGAKDLKGGKCWRGVYLVKAWGFSRAPVSSGGNA